eukprot:2340554-Pyramimonas_sp.AAC.1
MLHGERSHHLAVVLRRRRTNCAHALQRHPVGVGCTWCKLCVASSSRVGAGGLRNLASLLSFARSSQFIGGRRSMQSR